LGLPQDDNWFLIAKDNELPRVLHHMKSAPVNFVQKPPAPDEPFDIADLSAHDATFDRDPCAKHLGEPAIRRDWGRQVSHGKSPLRDHPVTWLSAG
jgi:hypothetical protein